MWGAGSWSILDAVGIQGYLMPGYVGKHLSGRGKDKTKAKDISKEEAEVTCISHSSGRVGGGYGHVWALDVSRSAPSLWQSSCPKC